MKETLTLEKLSTIPPNTIFASGKAIDTEDGLFMANTGKELRWVAVRGWGNDWAIYCHFSDKDIEAIKTSGEKVCADKHIKKLVSCDDEALGLYRH